MRSSYERRLALSALLWASQVANSFVPMGNWNVRLSNIRSRPSLLPSPRRTRLHVSMYNPKAASQDFYLALGVSPHASAVEIKQAYRKMAKKLHPDSNPGNDTTDQFQDLNRAYEVLSSPVLKNKYDLFGSNGVGTSAASDDIKTDPSYSPSGSSRRRRSSTSSGQGMSADGYGDGGIHNNPAETFTGYSSSSAYTTPGSFGESMNPSNVMDRQRWGGRGAGTIGSVGDDLHLDLDIDFETAVFGGREEVWIDHLETCDYCTGTGISPGSKGNYCETCGGAGFSVEDVETDFGMLQSQSTCSSCNGSGKESEQYCGPCNSDGSSEKSKLVEFTVPAGIEGYTRLRIRGEGNAGPKGGPAGDLFVFLKVKEHPNFRRDGSSILSNQTIDYIDAILGNTVTTGVIGGEEVLMDIPDGAQHDDVVSLEGHGARSLIGVPGARGEQIVSLSIEIPSELTKEEEDILIRLRELEARRKASSPPPRRSQDQRFPPGTTAGVHADKEDPIAIADAETIRINDFEVTYVAEEEPGESKFDKSAIDDDDDDDDDKNVEELIDLAARDFAFEKGIEEDDDDEIFISVTAEQIKGAVTAEVEKLADVLLSRATTPPYLSKHVSTSLNSKGNCEETADSLLPKGSVSTAPVRSASDRRSKAKTPFKTSSAQPVPFNKKGTFDDSVDPKDSPNTAGVPSSTIRKPLDEPSSPRGSGSEISLGSKGIMDGSDEEEEEVELHFATTWVNPSPFRAMDSDTHSPFHPSETISEIPLSVAKEKEVAAAGSADPSPFRAVDTQNPSPFRNTKARKDSSEEEDHEFAFAKGSVTTPPLRSVDSESRSPFRSVESSVDNVENDESRPARGSANTSPFHSVDSVTLSPFHPVGKMQTTDKDTVIKASSSVAAVAFTNHFAFTEAKREDILAEVDANSFSWSDLKESASMTEDRDHTFSWGGVSSRQEARQQHEEHSTEATEPIRRSKSNDSDDPNFEEKLFSIFKK